VLDESSENDTLLEEWLSEKSGKKVTVIIPKIGEQFEIVKMCRNNAAESLSKIAENSGRLHSGNFQRFHTQHSLLFSLF